MAVKEIIQVTCDRCGRVAKQDVFVKVSEVAGDADMSINNGQEDYCLRCARRVKVLLAEVTNPAAGRKAKGKPTQ